MIRPRPVGVGVRASGRTPSPGRWERGAVTAETVMVLPLMVAATLALVWLLALAVTQVRVTDAAREVARAVARDEDPTTALRLGRRVAPDGARIQIAESAGVVVVRVEARVGGPGGLLRFVRSVSVDAESVAGAEDR